MKKKGKAKLLDSIKNVNVNLFKFPRNECDSGILFAFILYILASEMFLTG